MMTPKTWLLQPYLPDEANEFCFALWEQYGFEINLAKPRKSKLGDYRYRVKQKTHHISINRDLNRFAFLLVYLHEVAHCLTNISHGLKVKPHGMAWKQHMRSLLVPMQRQRVFPPEIEEAIDHYMRSPKAASCSHPALTRALRRYDPISELVPLEELPEGAEFYFRSRHFCMIQRRRTRISCFDFTYGRMYLISGLTLVSPVIKGR